MAELTQLIKQNRFKAAENLLRKELEQEPENVYFLAQLANALWNLNKDEEALTYADKAKSISPTYPLTLFTRARVLGSLHKFEACAAEWEELISMGEAEVAEKGFGKGWAKSVINDARYYKAAALQILFRDKEALALMEEHLRHRGKGVQSDFTKKEATLLYKELKYSDFRPYVSETAEGFATSKQDKQIFKRLNKLEDAKQWDKLVRYLKGVCKRYPKEYYFHVRLSEYSKKVGNKADCLKYATNAFAQEPNDPLVKYNYAVALMYCGRNEDALAQFEGLVALGLDYIAYSEHGEGMRWAKKIMRHTQRHIEEIKQKEETAENH